jgi:hypothetical protein
MVPNTLSVSKAMVLLNLQFHYNVGGAGGATTYPIKGPLFYFFYFFFNYSVPNVVFEEKNLVVFLVLL